MPTRAIIWELEDHTLGKHRVLENYMGAWLPKIAKFNRQVLFVDGFAGPGEYRNGERGSPIIALDSFANHSAFERMKGRIIFVFIELDPDRAEHLERTVDLPPMFVPPVMLVRQARGQDRQARRPQAPAAGSPVSCAV